MLLLQAFPKLKGENFARQYFTNRINQHEDGKKINFEHERQRQEDENKINFERNQDSNSSDTIDIEVLQNSKNENCQDKTNCSEQTCALTDQESESYYSPLDVSNSFYIDSEINLNAEEETSNISENCIEENINSDMQQLEPIEESNISKIDCTFTHSEPPSVKELSNEDFQLSNEAQFDAKDSAETECSEETAKCNIESVAQNKNLPKHLTDHGVKYLY